MKTHTLKRTFRFIGSIVCLLLLLILELQAQVNDGGSLVSSTRFSDQNTESKMEVEYDGKIVFTENDKSIKSISRGGYLKISTISFGFRRELFAEQGSNGKIDYKYSDGKNEIDFDFQGSNGSQVF